MLVQHLAIAIVADLILIAAFGLAGTQPRPGWFVGMGLAIGFGSVAVRLLGPELIETSWPQRYDEELAAQRLRNNDSRTQFLATWVQESGRDPQTFERLIRPLLLELTRDRLLHRRGIDPEVEPDRARAVVGGGLWELISGPTARTASYAEIEQAVQTIEKL
ncbi:MAG TPA: hypothetical protein VFT31_18330 [Kribbella sp.]|nr:hypothetical protein [Kribbella sp.]